MNPSLSGEITAHYRVIKHLGRGGMGDVYLAEQMRVGRHVALKVLKRSLSEDPDIVRRFENEAVAAGGLDHPNIVRIYDCRTTSDGQVYVAMEYVKGESLRQTIHSGAPLALPVVVDIIGQIASGLEVAHQRGVVHRDVKPDNVMISRATPQPVVKIVDFGIARLLQGLPSSHTVTGSVLGSASYMSPEQAEGMTGDQIDCRADIYSLGMVAYEMLAGRVAFKASSWAALIDMQRRETPPPIKSFRPTVPDQFEVVVLKALEKDRSKRQQSALQFAEELKAALKPPPGGGPVVDPLLIPSAGHLSIPEDDSTPNPPSGSANSMSNQPIQPVMFSGRKFAYNVLAGLIVGILLIFLGYYINKWLIPKHPPPVIGVMKYEIRREREAADLITLPPDNTFRPGENLFFRVQLERPGMLYLFHKSKDGSMKWVNPGANNQPQLGSAEEWLDIPEEHWIGTKDIEPERFLFVYVPVGARWSFESIVHPESVTIGKSNLSEFPREAAERILGSLRADAVRMSSSSAQEGREVINSLRAPDPGNKVSYYEFELIPRPRG